VGNVSVLHELLEKHPAEALRYALLSAHYRQPLDWSDGLIEQSVKTLDRLYGTLRDLADVEGGVVEIPQAIEAALCDDLNTPQALAELASLAGQARRSENATERARLKSQLLSAGMVLGLLQQSPQAWFAKGNDESDDTRIQALVDERHAAKQAKNYARSDEIRKQLADEGILLEDTPQGVRWKRA
jgi:cysteinyl-tRNA synthetase